MSEQSLEACANSLAELSRRKAIVMVLTGAGISAESGIPTYRGRGGLWGRQHMRAMVKAEALRRLPRQAWEVLQQMREAIGASHPNPAHYALAELEELLRPGVRLIVVTQNIDGLHQAAGSRNVIELHGNITRFHCMVCGCQQDWLPLQLAVLPPRCACGGVIRPDVVLFGEPLPGTAWQEAQAIAQRAEGIIVIGTSLEVEPAASLPYEALRHGALAIEVNLDPTAFGNRANYQFRGFAGQVLPLLVQRLAHALGRATRRSSVPKA